jgi:hypothetical protein
VQAVRVQRQVIDPATSRAVQFDSESKMANQKHSTRRKIWLTAAFLIGMAGILVACGSSASSTPTPAAPLETPIVSSPTPVSYNELWKSSPHADARAAAFTHWDTLDPREIPARCAECHSRPGFVDFLGADGSPAGVVEQAVAPGTTITCYVCHNEVAPDLDSVTFPSGQKVSGLGRASVCATCHQGRASTVSVDDAILKAAAADDNTRSAKLVFVDSHNISAATSFGTEVQGAYEYVGKTYRGRFLRGGVFFNCLRCHDPHTQKVKVETCGDCHTFPGGDVKSIRVNTTDFAGDGNLQEGVSVEILHMQQKLYTAIQAYAAGTAGVPMVYDKKTYPYYFIDTNKNGKPEADELTAANKYGPWTPRLLRAAYNYNYVSHDPGAFAHNSTYIMQVLYDSLADVGGDVSGMTRP